ncbi:MAG: FAD-dependent monooxygenase [Balneolaceae bacterium]|nr:FAD-dependent monooxygenase [Balneolaceae bacterium]
MLDGGVAYPVLIAGGGPVGLYLATVLRQKGVDCLVIEKRTEQITHSRSLGIHPVSLELMEEIHLADKFLELGIQIREGMAMGNGRKLGTLSFNSCPGPYRFVLAMPQYKTEELLERHLTETAPGCLVRGAELVGVEERPEKVTVTVREGENSHTIDCDFLVGCDGKQSKVRQAAGFSFKGGSYPDTYLMGDYSDNTDFGSKAVIFLAMEGLIESFPLPENRRRWVVKTSRYLEKPTRMHLENRVAERIGHELGQQENHMLSSFGVQRFLAKPMAKGRIFLAGDAAHVVSPIGGQGMNLGWLGARELAGHLHRAIAFPDEADPPKSYHIRRTRAARQAIRRAEFNMKLGRKSKWPFLRNMLVKLMLNTPLERLMAQLFTMRGLNRWPI